VHFRQGNLFSIDPSLGSTTYDAIFCRNLMIYFDRATQDRAIRTLDRRLASKGVLFVAPSEAGVLMNHAFTAVKAPLASAFQKSSAIRRQDEPGGARSAPQPALRAAVPTTPCAMSTRGSAEREPVLPRVARAAQETLGSLDEAARLANRGDLAEAARHCEEHLRRCGPSARAFHLLGMVRDAAGDQSEAMACYRKALYLDPHQQEVLLHMALIMEKLGRQPEARLLRQRASRGKQLLGKLDVPPA
jgi:chemotaxis protein methyltransferase WspC